jgi:regulation of enolase protein 1 (concanavalin A-like superfamily)
MSLYADLATQQQVADYMGIDVGELPSDIDVRITRASEDITNLIHMNYDEDDDDHVEAAMFATCAQVQYIYEGADQGKYDQVKIGTLNVKYSESSKAKGSRVNPKSRDYRMVKLK